MGHWFLTLSVRKLMGICFLTLRVSGKIAFAPCSLMVSLRRRGRASSIFFAGFSKPKGSETVNETIKHRKGKGDAVQVAHSVMQYVIALAEKPVAPPKSVRQVLPNSKRGR